MEELRLSDLLKAIWAQKVSVILSAVVAAVFGFAITFLMPEIYEARVTLRPVAAENNSGFARLAGSIGGDLAAVLGTGGEGGSLKASYVATLRSGQFTYEFIEENDLLPLLFDDAWNPETQSWELRFWRSSPPTLWMAYNKFDKGVRTIQENPRTGLITLIIQWRDPKLAAEWANKLVADVNEYLRAKAIDRANSRIEFLEEKIRTTDVGVIREVFAKLLEQEMQIALMANANQMYAFDVLDKAVVPEKRIRPNRAAFSVMFLLIGGFIGSLHAVFRSPTNQ